MRKKEKLNKNLLIDGFKKFSGNIRAVAEHLQISHQTIYNFISKNPELEDILLEERKGRVIERLDAAEFVLDYMMNQKTTLPRLAYDTSKYILETHGKKRGYTKSKDSEEDTPSRDIIIELENKIMDLEAQLNKERNANKNRGHSSPKEFEIKDIHNENTPLSETYYQSEAESEFS